MTTAIITGGSRGIGRAIVKALAEEGVFVLFTYRGSEESARTLEAELTAAGLQARGVCLDVTDGAACRDLVDGFYKECGAPDILINNAGITEDSLLFAMKEEQWDRVIDTDLGGVFHMSRAAVLHMMKARKGRIVNIASISGLNGVRGQCNYAAAKGAVISFTKSLAKETAALGIAVNAVAPGGVESDMTKALSPQALAEMVRDVPAGRLCSPEEVAGVAVYLATRAPLYLTGATIVLDGGLGSL